METTGYGEVQKGTPETQERADKIRQEVETKLGKNFKNFTVAKFTQQVAEGLNYKMKVQVNDDAYRFIHVAIHEALPSEGGKLSLISVEEGKTCCSAL